MREQISPSSVGCRDSVYLCVHKSLSLVEGFLKEKDKRTVDVCLCMFLLDISLASGI
mgnify:CR=1 FL=1